MAFTEILGYVAAVCTTVSFVPQVWKIWKERTARDISLAAFLIFSSGVFAWFIYGLLLGVWPIILCNFITWVLSLIVIYFKVRFKN
jgi:MtN3 and saliva related transmembrane protein